MAGNCSSCTTAPTHTGAPLGVNQEFLLCRVCADVMRVDGWSVRTL